MARPTDDIEFGTTGLTLEPATLKKQEGFLGGKKLPARWLNWFMRGYYRWIAWLEGESDTHRSILANMSARNWTAASASEANSWNSVKWSPELGLFVAVASSGTNRVMHSTKGTSWTAASASAAN
jgi:hypothetical protein